MNKNRQRNKQMILLSDRTNNFGMRVRKTKNESMCRFIEDVIFFFFLNWFRFD